MSAKRLVDEQLEVSAARLVVLVMFYVAHPQLAPDLNQCALAHVKLNKHQRCQVALRVVVRKVLKRVS